MMKINTVKSFGYPFSLAASKITFKMFGRNSRRHIRITFLNFGI